MEVSIILLILTISGFLDGTMDTLQFHYSTSIFKKLKNQLFWDPQISWKNKYLDGDSEKGPRFFLSTTLLVSLTDGWHLIKFFRNLSIFASLPFIGFISHDLPLVLAFIVFSRLFYGVGFWLAYDIILKKDNI